MNSASLCSLAGRYDNPIPTRYLAPMDCLKMPSQGYLEEKQADESWAGILKKSMGLGTE